MKKFDKEIFKQRKEIIISLQNDYDKRVKKILFYALSAMTSYFVGTYIGNSLFGVVFLLLSATMLLIMSYESFQFRVTASRLRQQYESIRELYPWRNKV